ncbi:Puf6p [Sugiyamaella lignohabitans]|uniref:Puf6p n=1 Tax=Sugiyamaella lignohabitans TaxID=796027 RepID=A0A161HF31_9ASCO|nr:Puf6p [Sugiyamaella lignohabitans]ANB11021.1 Puf6p [Sugiyamaella lignohabitans]
MGKTAVKLSTKRKAVAVESRKPVTNGKLKKAKKEEEVVEESEENEDDFASSDDESINLSSDDSDEDELDKDDDEEDELDQDEEVDEEGNGSEDGEEDEEGLADDGSKTARSKEQRAEQKKLQQERKLQRSGGVEIQQIKNIWERLRVKTGVPTEVRKKLVDQAWELCHDKVKELVFKHDASRVVQTIFKYADKEKRLAITKALKGSYVELAKSSYGKYLLVKLLHYGSSDVRDGVLSEMHGSFRKLIKHKEGAYVIEDAYRDYSTAAHKSQIISEFYGSEFAIFKDIAKDKSLEDIIKENPDKRPYLMKNLNEVITSAVNKGSIGFTIIHAAMLEYVKNIDATGSEREVFIDLITEQFAEIVHTNEGSQVACRVLSIATAKERKGLVRSLKPFASKLASDEYGYLVLIALFRSVDDTVLVSKSFTADLKENINSLIVSKTGRRAFLYLLLGLSPRYFTPTIIKKFNQLDELKAATSKKDDEVRRTELLKAFSPLFFEAISANTRTILKESLGAQFVAEALLYGIGEDDRQKALESVASAFGDSSPDADNGTHLIHEPFSTRLLRTLVQDGHWDAKEKRANVVSSPTNFKALLLTKVLEFPAEWATGDGSFVVVSLVENLESADKATLVKVLKKHKKAITAASADNKGAKLLVEHL